VKLILRLIAAVHAVIAALFAASALVLVYNAARFLARGVTGGLPPAEAATSVIEGIGLLAIALVGLEIAQTVVEEEIVREAHISAPTRVRRYLSRFLVVVVVALSIETLVGTFSFLHGDPANLRYAALIGVSAAAILASWGVFVRLNRSAEELEPEAMREAKAEDEKLQG
jgi:hypothetical protein